MRRPPPFMVASRAPVTSLAGGAPAGWLIPGPEQPRS